MFVREFGQNLGGGHILSILLVVLPEQVEHGHRLGVLDRAHLQVVLDERRSSHRKNGTV